VLKSVETKLQQTIIVTVVFIGVRPKGYRLRVFENRVIMRIFGLNRDEVTERWRK
jgi:hypothetical protein